MVSLDELVAAGAAAGAGVAELVDSEVPEAAAGLAVAAGESPLFEFVLVLFEA